jgi:DNA-binding NarL/FixJ family response regulator
MKKKVHIVDDHAIFSNALSILINQFDDYEVDFCGANGKELIFRLQNDKLSLPDIILLDLNMPVMSGEETMDWMKKHKPEIPVLVLTMQDNDQLMINMLSKGVQGYLLKDISPIILKKALDDTLSFGYYHTPKVSLALIKSLNYPINSIHDLKDHELDLLKLCCSDKTYKEIADIMHLSPKTIDGYRHNLFTKLDVKSRVGLVLYAIKNKIITL